jgi:hypothetical protein
MEMVAAAAAAVEAVDTAGAGGEVSPRTEEQGRQTEAAEAKGPATEEGG